LDLDKQGTKLGIVSGANGAGKTTYLKMVALNIILAQIGCFVVAKRMVFTPFNSINCKGGDISIIN
jgi:DNA mismatch repair ATPase MutS